MSQATLTGAKGRFTGFLDRVPVHVIVGEAALIGAAAMAPAS
jgi:glucokinase